ncbi:MAG: serine/threonine-protein kinase [Planctomycetota bacterium]
MVSGSSFGPDGCLTDAALRAIESGGPLDTAGDEHLAGCERCQARLDALVDRDDLLTRLRVSTEVVGSAALDRRLPSGYEDRGELHRGAQGVVIRAWHERTKREVAVKLLLGGTLSTVIQRARFEREVELAASLAHPGIVSVFDSGVTERGEPYIVMELVDGVPLSDRIRAGVEPGSVARLMADVCGALAHAHTRGVIHRDLKPSNILVDSAGRPRVVDFGIARGLMDPEGGASLTADDAFLGTLGYAAPEQVRGRSAEADTRTDVYALGLVLYEMLTGRMAQGAGEDVAEVMRRVTESTPTPPRLVNREVPSDLSAITMNAIEKDPDRRYRSAQEMGEDLRNWIAGRPVVARGAGPVYVAGKFLARHRFASVAGAIAVVLLSGSISGIVLTRAAERRAESAKTSVRDSLYDMLLQANIDEARGSDVRELLLRHVPIVEERLAAFPMERAEVNIALGDAMMSRDLLVEALERFERAVADRLAELGPEAEAVARARLREAEALWRLARFTGALESFTAARNALAALPGVPAVDVLDTDRRIASTLSRLGRLGEAEELHDQTILALRGLGPDATAALANALNSRAVTHSERGDLDAALKDVDASLRLIKTLGGDRDRERARLLSARASYLRALRRFDQAESTLVQALELKRRWRGVDDRDVAQTLHELAALTAYRIAEPKTGADYAALDEAATRAAESLMIREAAYRREPHPDVADSLLLLGEIRRKLGSAMEAERLLRESLAEWEESGQTGRKGYALTHERLARTAAQLGQEERALALAETALKLLQATSSVPETAVAADLVASLCDALGYHDRATEARALQHALTNGLGDES